MFIFFFDPTYTSSKILSSIKKVLDIKYVFSLMREEDLSDELKKLHKSARFMTFWEPSTTVKYNTAYKVIAHKIISIISKEVYDNGNFIGYNGEVGKIIQHRPIYTLISKTVNHPSTYGSNILILRRRQFYNSWVIAPQMPFGGLM